MIPVFNSRQTPPKQHSARLHSNSTRTHLLKTERGLLNPRQPLWNTRRRSSRLRTPAMSTPLRPRRESRRRSAGPVGSGRYFMARAPGVLRRPHTICRESGGGQDPASLEPSPHPETRGKAVLLSGPQAEAFLLLERLFLSFSFFLLFTLVLGLDVRVPYHWGMTGAVGDITPTRVSHHSGPAKIEADNGWLTHYSICPRQIPVEVL